MLLHNGSTLTQALQLPEDFQKGHAFVSMEGRERVCVENFKGICSYTAEELRLTAGRAIICVRGKHLQIDSYTKEEIEISGLIEAICYE